jgi:hypothetical protein
MRLYCLICRDPSGRRTATETYWPGRAGASGAPSALASTKLTVSGDSCVRWRTVSARHTSPGATPAEAYRPFSISMRACAMCQ